MGSRLASTFYVGNQEVTSGSKKSERAETENWEEARRRRRTVGKTESWGEELKRKELNRGEKKGRELQREKKGGESEKEEERAGARKFGTEEEAEEELAGFVQVWLQHARYFSTSHCSVIPPADFHLLYKWNPY